MIATSLSRSSPRRVGGMKHDVTVPGTLSCTQYRYQRERNTRTCGVRNRNKMVKRWSLVMAGRRKEGLIRVGIEYRTVAAESVIIRRPLVDLIQIGIDCSFNPNSKLASVHFMLIHRTRRVPTRDGATRNCQLPSAPRFERANTSGGETFVRQGALVGDP